MATTELRASIPTEGDARQRVLAPPARRPRQRGRIGLLEGAQRWTICDVDPASSRALRIVAAAGVELRAMVGKRQQVPDQKGLEAGPRGLNWASASASAPRAAHVGQAPADFRIAARERREERVRVIRVPSLAQGISAR